MKYPAQHAVPYPSIKESSQLGMVQFVKERLDIHLDDPATPHPRRLLPESLKCLVSRPSRPKPGGAA
jgi:hypothetical protein